MSDDSFPWSFRTNPVLTEAMLARWQEFLDTLVAVIDADAALLLRATGKDLEVCVASHKTGTPHHPGDRQRLPDAGRHYEALLGARAGLLVGAYLGLPIGWPDGSPFGVICVLTQKDPAYSDPHRLLVGHFRDVVEDPLVRATETSQRSQTDAAERAQQEERARMLMEHASDDFFLHDVDGKVLDVNRHACQNMGYSRDELLQMYVTDFSIGANRDTLRTLWAGTQPGHCPTVFADHRRQDGTIFPVEVRVACLVAHGKKLFFTMVRDISEHVA